MHKITPMLWFVDQAEEAAQKYISVFASAPRSDGPEASKIVEVSRYGEAGPGPAGTAMVVRFLLDGHEFTALNGGEQGFAFSEAISFVVECQSQEEVDYFWAQLTEGGEEGPCGWLKDRFGLSWQVVPTALGTMLGDPDREKAERATKAMLGMRKIDIAEMKRAFDGEGVAPAGAGLPA